MLGEHPDKGGPIVVKNGRYGPYVSHNGVNATLTGDKTPDTVTLEEAVGLARRARRQGRQCPEGTPRRRPARPPPARPPPPKPAAKPKKAAAAAANAKPARRTKATAAE